jgi:hypothetical protein
MQQDKVSKHGVGTTRPFRPAGVTIPDSVVSEERSGHVQAKAATGKPAPHAIAPPLSEKPIPTTSIAERLRARLKKGD